MSQGDILRIMQEAIYTIIIVSAPLLLIGLIIGVLISVFQAATQINEQTMVFVPKILGIFITLIIFGGWMLTKLSDFTLRLFDSITTLIK
ncbi:MAG: flagellar biosynthesis protein FliQ [Bacillota bacterium]|nr:flagellar biosynthesis protein FliQ [Bacillota bacterium]